MPIAASMQKSGFRRWHERQLVEAHCSLVTAFLGVIMIAVCLDQLRWRDPGAKPLLMLTLAVVGIALCFKSVTFYFKTLFRAEHFAAQAVCERCKVYGLIEILHAHDSGPHEWLSVRCKKCGHDWTLTAYEPAAPGEESR